MRRIRLRVGFEHRTGVRQRGHQEGYRFLASLSALHGVSY
jgi:hypothetical protein